MKLRLIIINTFFFCFLITSKASTPLYHVFEKEIINKNNYTNKFTDVTLEVQYQSPSGKVFNFWVFFDGNGEGNMNGNVWKMRFMPNETGEWKYVYNWTDSTKGGNRTFNYIKEGAGKIPLWIGLAY